MCNRAGFRALHRRDGNFDFRVAAISVVLFALGTTGRILPEFVDVKVPSAGEVVMLNRGVEDMLPIVTPPDGHRFAVHVNSTFKFTVAGKCTEGFSHP